mgnify:CR=1 FL=1
MRPVFGEMKARIRKLFLIYGLCGLFLVAALSGALLMKKYTDTLYATLDRLQEFNVQYIKVRTAMDDIDRSLNTLKAAMPRDFSEDSVEEHMLLFLDDLKARAASTEIAITSIEKKDGDFQLPAIIRGPVKDYTALVNLVGHLQSQKFPFFGITGVKIQKSEDPTVTAPSFEIKGAVKFPTLPVQTKETATRGMRGNL